MQTLDIHDRRRGDLFADATCANCDHFTNGTVGWACDAEAYVLIGVISDLMDANPDAHIPGLRMFPVAEHAANRCPGFWPSRKYQEDLMCRDYSEVACWREDMDRLAKMGRRAA